MGIIPARAGSTPRDRESSALVEDHPRSRGVHSAWPSLVAVSVGSSPLARGPPVKIGTGYSVTGIIPARAGSTEAGKAAIAFGEDHPRSRGVHRLLVVGLLHDLRIIPARAGSTAVRHLHRGAVEDHPRSRGVHHFQLESQVGHVGSSPLARGPPEKSFSMVGAMRIIPARAGSTRIAHHIKPVEEDHPRSRGVHSAPD